MSNTPNNQTLSYLEYLARRKALGGTGGTGFTGHYEELHFRQNYVENVALFRDFFADSSDGNQILVKEDHAFWYRVREAGFQIVAIDNAKVVHAGTASHYAAVSQMAKVG